MHPIRFNVRVWKNADNLVKTAFAFEGPSDNRMHPLQWKMLTAKYYVG